MHDALSAEHRARYAMQSAQWQRDNEASEDYREAEDQRDEIDAMSRNPHEVSEWIANVPWLQEPPNKVLDFDALLVWDGAVSFEGLMTALVGGTEEQGIKAMWQLRRMFEAWAEDRVHNDDKKIDPGALSAIFGYDDEEAP